MQPSDFDIEDFRSWLESLPQDEPLPGVEGICPLDKWMGNTECHVGVFSYTGSDGDNFTLPNWARIFVRRIDSTNIIKNGRKEPLVIVWSKITPRECLAHLDETEYEQTHYS